MLNRIKEIHNEISSVIVDDPDQLEKFRIKYLGKKGILSLLFEDFRNIAPEQKKEVGLKLNLLKQELQEKYNSLKEILSSVKNLSNTNDLTRPAYLWRDDQEQNSAWKIHDHHPRFLALLILRSLYG